MDYSKIVYNDYKRINESLNQINEYIGTASAGQEKGDDPMDWQQKYFDHLESDIKETKDSILRVESSITSKVDQHTTRIQGLLSDHISRVQDLLSSNISEIRHLDNQRKQDIDNISTRLDSQNKWLIGLIITTILGIAAMVITVILN